MSKKWTVDSESIEGYNNDGLGYSEFEKSPAKRPVLVRSLIASRMKYRGQKTGKLYVWEGSGSVVEVDEEDVSDILSKSPNRPCCGSRIPPKIFELAS